MTQLYLIYYPWGFLVYHKSERYLNSQCFLKKKKSKKLGPLKKPDKVEVKSFLKKLIL